jgi:pimeloyl-ACP methyl ester carboxylesterase
MNAPPPLYDAVALSALKLQGYKSRRIPTSAGKLHVLEARGTGSLPPLVLLHGLSSAGVHYHPILPRLRRRARRIVMPDMLGHGFSDVPKRGLDVREMERALVETLDAVIDEPVLLFGLSMGGAAAIRYASLRPERVRGLMLCSPGGAAMDAPSLDLLRRSFVLADHADALAFVDKVFAKRTALRHAYAWGVRKTFERPAVRALIDSLRTEDLLDPEEVASLRMPVKLVWGRKDRVLPLECKRFFLRHLPEHAEIHEPTSFGHSPFLDDPEGLADSIEAFLEQLARRPSLAEVPTEAHERLVTEPPVSEERPAVARLRRAG